MKLVIQLVSDRLEVNSLHKRTLLQTSDYKHKSILVANCVYRQRKISSHFIFLPCFSPMSLIAFCIIASAPVGL